jgi:hypothetical protein
MEWRLDEPTGTLEVIFPQGSAPPREEVEAFLRDVKPLVEDRQVRTLAINGTRVSRRGAFTSQEIAGPVRYEAAQWRGLRPRASS